MTPQQLMAAAEWLKEEHSPIYTPYAQSIHPLLRLAGVFLKVSSLLAAQCNATCNSDGHEAGVRHCANLSLSMQARRRKSARRCALLMQVSRRQAHAGDGRKERQLKGRQLALPRTPTTRATRQLKRASLRRSAPEGRARERQPRCACSVSLICGRKPCCPLLVNLAPACLYMQSALASLLTPAPSDISTPCCDDDVSSRLAT